jgi:predicted nucleotide-binding protein/nucleoside 2-deoxyribosyltransferase
MESKTCFLISPLGMPGSESRRRSDQIYDYVIEPGVHRAGYTLLRPDQMAVAGSITSLIFRYLLESPIVIADLTGLNPNVMYELGVRHAVGKPVIPIISKDSTIPFDIAVVRTIMVDVNDIDSVAKASNLLSEIISEIEKSPERYESPISIASAIRAIKESIQEESHEPESAFPSTVVGVLRDMENRLNAIEQIVSRSVRRDDNTKEYSRRVFIVHGHDGELKNELARFLERLDFEPVILHEQPDRGQTILAKLQGEMSDVGFAFVILSPDDVGAVASDTSSLKSRARQNVVFEHGLFLGHLTPQRICAIRKGDVEIPSDLYGVLYKTVLPENGIRSIAIDIANELRAAGYILDANKLLSI